MIQSQSNEKFHPIYGRFLKVALDSAFNPGVKVENILLAGIQLSDREQQKLTHRGQNYDKISQLALIEKNPVQVQTSKITFVPWVETEGVQFYCLNFRLEPIGRNYPIFARFDEEKSFSNKYVNLDYFSLTRESGFKSVYVKIMDQRKAVYVKIESQEMGILEISQVQQSDVPSYLVQS